LIRQELVQHRARCGRSVRHLEARGRGQKLSLPNSTLMARKSARIWGLRVPLMAFPKACLSGTCSNPSICGSNLLAPTACPSFLSEHEWMLRAGYMLALRIELACILPGMKRLSHAIGTATSRCSHAWRGDHVEFDWARGCRWAWRRAGGGASSIGQGVNSCRSGMSERRTSASARLPRKRPPKPSSARTNHRRFS